MASAYGSIREAIVEGTYRPGQRLVEQRIAEDFDLSRTPVREALRLLQAEGLVHIEPNRGSVVRTLDLDDVADLYELRARLEAYAAERAATRITPAELERIDEALERFDAAVPAAASGRLAGLREVNRWNNEVHGTIVEAARHERLASMLARTVDHPLVFQAFRQFDEAQLERSGLFHRLLRTALGGGDPARAASLMNEHVLQGRDALLVALSSVTSLEALFDGTAGEPGHLPPRALRSPAT